MESTSTGLSDKFGRDICVGHRVVYPVRRGSSTYLNDAVITGVLNGKLSAVKDGGVQIKLHLPGRCAIVEV